MGAEEKINHLKSRTKKTNSRSLLLSVDGKEQEEVGRHFRIEAPMNGWVMCVDFINQFFYLDEQKRTIGREHIHTLLSLDGKEQYSFPLHCDIFDFHSDMQFGDMKFRCCAPDSKQGVWSVNEDRSVLSPIYDHIMPYRVAKDTFAVVYNGRLQHRGTDDVLIRDFGEIRYSTIPRHDDKQGHYLIVKGTKNRYHCVDYVTGERCSPNFLKIAALSEGVRYMCTEDGRHCFVDEHWSEVFEFPYEPFDPDPPTRTYPMRDMNTLAYLDGKVVVNTVKTSYLLDKQGNLLNGKLKRRIFNVGNNRIMLAKGSSLALADLEGNLITDFSYLSPSVPELPFFDSGHLILDKKVRSKRRAGSIDANGNELLPFIYWKLGNYDLMGRTLFSDGFISAELNEPWDY